MMSNLEPLNLEAKLKELFGYNTFRAYQKEIIQAVLNQQDVLAILPTGAGKSLCYQLPAMVMSGTAVVVSPLISLMQDQVVSLFKNGIPAAFLNSSLHYADLLNVLDHLSDYKLLYVAPERFSDPHFIERLKEIPLSFFVIDEAHCISQWGHSFRLEYRKLSILKQHFPDRPIMALTATATREVECDMIEQLSMKHPQIIKGSFDRPNLTIRINQKINPDGQLRRFLEQRQTQSGIIYAATRKTVDATFNQLQQEGFTVGRYHAGMTDQERIASQHAFLYGQINWMVATVAFGMGIHKPDVRFIVHLDMPKTIEQYYQEIGRAGRDGFPAECLMLYGVQDLVLYKVLLEQLPDPALYKQLKAKTDRMYALCTSNQCRRKALLHYFGELTAASSCVACDNCLDDVEMVDGTIIAQKILSCVFRLRQNFGMRMVIDVLRGSKNQAILSRGYDQLSTYGLLADLSEAELRYYIESLVQMGFLELTLGEYPVLKWTQSSKLVIDNQEQVQFRKKIFKETKIRENQILHYNEQLFADLKQLRQEVAQQENVPPFVIFSDRTLQEMAVYYPKNQQEFSKINGVGPIKWIKYGQKFLQKIQSYGLEHPLPINEKVYSPLQRQHSIEETIRLYQEGKSLEEIMQARQLAKSTILTHLAEGIKQGIINDISRLVSKTKQEIIEAIIRQIGAGKLASIKEKLAADFTYDEIRLVAAFHRNPQANVGIRK